VPLVQNVPVPKIEPGAGNLYNGGHDA